MMKRVLTTAMLALGLAAQAPDGARAGGVPTIDVASITQQVAILMESISQTEIAGQSLSSLGKQLSELYDMGRTLDDQLSAITGARESIAGLFSAEIAALESRVGALGDLVDWRDLKSGAIAGEIEALATRYGVMEGKALYPDANPAETHLVKAHDELTNTTLVSLAMTDRSFDDSTAAISRLEALRVEIGRANDLQSSLALNSRIQVELGILLAQQMQLDATARRMEAARFNNELREHERQIAGYRIVPWELTEEAKK